MNFITWKIVVKHDLMWMFFFVCLHWTRQFFMFINVQKYDDIWKFIILYSTNLWIIFRISLLQPAPPSNYFRLHPWLLLIVLIKLWCHHSLHIRSQNAGWSWWDKRSLTVIRRCFWSLVSTGSVSTNRSKFGIYPGMVETTLVWPEFQLVQNQSVSLPD